MHRANQFYVALMLLRWQGKQILQFSHTISIPIFNPFTPSSALSSSRVTEFDKWDVNQGDGSLQPDHSRIGDSSPMRPSPPRMHLDPLHYNGSIKGNPVPLSPLLEKTPDQAALNID